MGRIVYWGSGSPPAWRVLLMLEEKGLEYESRLITFSSGCMKKPEMRALNPRGMVPIYVEDDIVMYESLAILSYIESQHPSVQLIPREPKAQSLALMRMHESNNVSSAAGEVIYYVRRTPPDQVNMEYLHAKRKALYMELALWEYYLRKVACSAVAGSKEKARECTGCNEQSLARVQREVAEATRLAEQLAGPGPSGVSVPVVPHTDRGHFPPASESNQQQLAQQQPHDLARQPPHELARQQPHDVATRADGSVTRSGAAHDDESSALANQRPSSVVDQALVAPVFVAGMTMTVADVAFFPCLAYLVRCGLDLRKFPFLHAYYDRMRGRPSVLRSWPPHWRETPGLPLLSLTHVPTKSLRDRAEGMEDLEPREGVEDEDEDEGGGGGGSGGVEEED